MPSLPTCASAATEGDDVLEPLTTPESESADVLSSQTPPSPAKLRRRLAMAAGGSAAALLAMALVAGLARRGQLASAAVGGAVEFAEVADTYKPWECAADGEDCRETQCCSKAGSQCFVKNEGWASCNATCTRGKLRGDKDHDPWSCEKLGEPAPPACSWEGENCAASKCCRRAGFKCFQKDDQWASCSDDCAKLSKPSAGGEPWTCNVLGGSKGVHFVQAEPNKSAGTSLFCFTVVTPQGVVAPGVKPGYEGELLHMMKKKGVSLFACDASKVYEGVRVQKGSWQSVVNTDIFITVWKKVQADGIYKKHSWTVKVDADAVFLPFRLKAHLGGLHAPKDTPVYLHNINFKFHFQGALEVLSAKAVDEFLANAWQCAEHLGRNGGEDFFTMQCLDAMGVGHMTDFSLLDDKYTRGHGWNLFDVDPCVNPAVVSFHPYKHVNSWMGCYKVAMGIQKPSDFIGCSFRWPGDACSLSSQNQHAAVDVKPSDGIIFRK